MGKQKKIVMIGPVYPYRGGIAHYTGLMYKALAKTSQVSMISFRLQYPRLLYKKEQKDFGNDTFKVDHTEYLIHTVNPFSWLDTAWKIRKRKPDLVIIQWWHPYFAFCYWFLRKLLKKIPVLFICHNVFPHERFFGDVFLTKHVLKGGDFFIVQSAQDEKYLLSVKQDAVYRRTVHPTYNAFKLCNLSKENARAQLHIAMDEKVLLFFGFVREYKGLKHLLRAMPEAVQRLGDIKLLVVGEFAADKKDYLNIIDKLGISRFVKIYDAYIPDREVEKFFAACDLVVLPYESATQSGIVQIAYGFEKPVLATRTGGLSEVVADGRTGYLVEPGDCHQIAQRVIQFYEKERGWGISKRDQKGGRNVFLGEDGRNYFRIFGKLNLIWRITAVDLSERSGSKYRHPWELSRTEILLKELNKLEIHGKVLDIGCGDAYFDKRLIHTFPEIEQIWGIDIHAEKNIHKGKEHYINSYDAIQGKKFDFVLLMDVLEHMENDVLFLESLHQYLEKGAVLFITVPAFQSLFSLHDRQLHHFRRYRFQGLHKKLKKSGYVIKDWTYFYVSLILLRIISKGKTQNLGMWKRSEKNLVTLLIKWCLDMDYRVLRFLSNKGIHIGGLSLLVICGRGKGRGNSKCRKKYL